MIRAMRSAQRGMSIWQWLIVLVVGGFLLTIVATVGPVYIRNYTLEETVKALQNEPELASLGTIDMRAAIQKKFDVNRIEDMQAVCLIKEKACLKIDRTKTHVRIDANYEARVHVMGNVDAVVMFRNNFIEIPIPGAG
jgi:hypothetical protein